MIPKSWSWFSGKIILNQKNYLVPHANRRLDFNKAPLPLAGLQQIVEFAFQRIERGEVVAFRR